MFGATQAVAGDTSKWLLDPQISGLKVKTIKLLHGQISL